MSESSKKDPKTNHANSVIKNHMIWSMGAGFIPVPVADFFAVSAIQLDMIRQLSKIYDINFKETEGKAVISALTGSGIARIGARAIKFIPGVGSILGGVTLAVLSGASTYALGEVFKKHFETGGTFLDFDPGRLKKFYDEKFEKGKQMAKDMENVQRTKHDEAESVSDNPSEGEDEESVIDKLTSLNALLKDGAITKKEFDKLKKDLLA